jgi:cytochrome P450
VANRPDLLDAYDPTLDAVVLRSYAAVSAALDEPRLVPLGESDGDAARAARTAVRVAARELFPNSHRTIWLERLQASARSLATDITRHASVDLVAAFAAPWGLEIALAATGDLHDDPTRLAGLARTIFLDAAHTTNGEISGDACAAAAELALSLQPASHRTTIDVQSFVALSQTLPCFLAAAWLGLFTHVDAAESLRSGTSVAPAIDELLRFAGPSRAVFRRATVIARIGSVEIGAGRRVVLELASANHDPARFDDPERLDLSREASAHLAFGSGSHSCVGATMIRSATEIATRALLAAIPCVPSIEHVEWIDGFALRAPSSLIVTVPSSPR